MIAAEIDERRCGTLVGQNRTDQSLVPDSSATLEGHFSTEDGEFMRGQGGRDATDRYARRRPRLFAFEVMEWRCLPSAFVVTTTADSGPGTLRQAITSANN